jgi:hypothetical protein
MSVVHRAAKNMLTASHHPYYKRLSELCAHAGIGDTLLQSWEGISANQALEKSAAVTKLVGKDYLCTHFADVRSSFLDREAMIDFLEHPEMGTHVAALLLQHEVPFPIRFASQLKMSVQNRGVPEGGMCRDCDVTFRASKKMYGKPWYDTVRYNYVMTDPEGVDQWFLAYGRCVLFLEDSSGLHSMILQCYNPYIKEVAAGGLAPNRHVADTLDRVAQLVPLHLAALNRFDSYMWITEEAVVNGGFILEDPHITNKHWVQQGHREGLKFQEFAFGQPQRQGQRG